MSPSFNCIELFGRSKLKKKRAVVFLFHLNVEIRFWDKARYQYIPVFQYRKFPLFKRRKFVLNEAKNSSIKYYGSLPFYYESMMEVCPSLIMICTRTWICHIRRVSIVFILLSKLQNQNNQFGRFFKIEITNSYHKFRIVIFSLILIIFQTFLD